MVTQTGIRTSVIRPAGKNEVVVSIRGIHPNTKDSVVIDYLNKFGKVVSTKVVHSLYTTGPLAGLTKGNRSYKMEIKRDENMGSYHLIDGLKVSVRYPGQRQTCGRCHNVPQHCPGKGIAKKCESEGGDRVDFADYIQHLWNRVGYSPPLSDNFSENLASATEVEEFTPVKKIVLDNSKYAGITIKYLSPDADLGEFTEYLCQRGLPEESKDQITIKGNGIASIADIGNEVCQLLIKNLEGQTFHGKKLKCS